MVCTSPLMRQRYVVSKIAVLLLLGFTLLPAFAAAATRPPSVSITLSPSVPSPELLGTSVLWTATVNGGAQGHTYDYQFAGTVGSFPSPFMYLLERV